MSLEPILELLNEKGNLTVEEISARVGVSQDQVREKIAAWEQDQTILGYQTIINPEKITPEGVSAFIEVKLTPERGGGFNSLAKRISKFHQVVSCYLASGRYDLLLIVKGKDLMEIANFVSEKLSTLNGVLSTETHFRLKGYKDNGFLLSSSEEQARLPVTP